MLRMRIPALLVAVSRTGAGCSTGATGSSTSADQESIRKTDEGILAAFARGDVDGIMAFHHPDVAKALAYDNYAVGSDAVRKNLTETLGRFRLEFIGHHVESLAIYGDTAVEQPVFTIKGTPIGGGTPFVFKGRAMVMYLRYGKSPTGWASLREIIQPATP